MNNVAVKGSAQYHYAKEADDFTLCGRLSQGKIDLRNAMHRTKSVCPKCRYERSMLNGS
jgi:hypothetical protein